jgi:hypothetical protein
LQSWRQIYNKQSGKIFKIIGTTAKYSLFNIGPAFLFYSGTKANTSFLTGVIASTFLPAGTLAAGVQQL